MVVFSGFFLRILADWSKTIEKWLKRSGNVFVWVWKCKKVKKSGKNGEKSGKTWKKVKKGEKITKNHQKLKQVGQVRWTMVPTINVDNQMWIEVWRIGLVSSDWFEKKFINLIKKIDFTLWIMNYLSFCFNYWNQLEIVLHRIQTWLLFWKSSFFRAASWVVASLPTPSTTLTCLEWKWIWNHNRWFPYLDEWSLKLFNFLNVISFLRHLFWLYWDPSTQFLALMVAGLNSECPGSTGVSLEGPVGTEG